MNDAEHLLKYFTIDFYAYGVEVGVADFSSDPIMLYMGYLLDFFG